MPSSAVYELAILLSLKDAASGGLDRFENRLRASGKEGKQLLKTVQDLRQDLSRNLSIAGAGLATLAVLKGGVQAAADYESAILDLKSAYQETATAGNTSLAGQAAQLQHLESLAIRLGNNLQGSTQDYVGILSSLKKAGVDATTVLNGAGESAANLANVSGALARGQANEQAKQLGQFGKMYDLKPEDFPTSVNLFSALKDRFDIESSDLIEAAKYFQATATSLKLTGISGAADVSKFFALMKREGAIEGSQAGTSATSFFQQYLAHADKLKELKKTTGIDLKFSDTKGNFLGWENAFKQMEQFRKLQGEERLRALNEVFGEQGGKVAGVMVESGAEGWRNVTTEAAKAVSVNEKIIQQMATYNAKMEAFLGTIENIKSVTFGPMLETLKPLLDMLNQGAGKLQEWGKAHPEIAKVVTQLIGLAGIAMTIKGGLDAATAAWKLYRIAMAAGGVEAAVATTKTTGLMSSLRNMPKSVQISILLLTVGYTVEKIMEMLNAIKEYEASDARAKAEAQRGVKSYYDLKQRFADQGQEMPRNFAQAKAAGAFSAIDREGTLVDSLRGGAWFGIKKFFDVREIFGPNKSPFYSTGQQFQANLVKERAPQLAIPEVMAEFRKKIQSLDVPANAKASFEKTLQIAFPESFLKSTIDLGMQFGKLNTELDALYGPLQKTSESAVKLPDSFERTRASAARLSAGLDMLDFKLQNFSPSYAPVIGGYPPPPAPAPRPGLSLPSFPYLPFGKTSSSINIRPSAPTASSPAVNVVATLPYPYLPFDKTGNSNTGARPSAVASSTTVKAAAPLPYLPFRNTSGNKTVGDIHLHFPPGSAAGNSPREVAAVVREEVRKALDDGDAFAQQLSAHSPLIEDLVEYRFGIRKERT